KRPNGGSASVAGLAMNHHFAVTGDLPRLRFDIAEWNKLGSKVNNIVLVRLPDIDKLKILSPRLRRVQFAHGYFFHRTVLRVKSAKLHIVDQFPNGGIFSVKWVGRISPEFERPGFKRQGIKHKQPAAEYVAYAGDDLDDFQRLETPDNTRQDSQDA